ncbi:MAG: DUF1501 domain-containing protein [Planctomycetaceae bacterium]|nr:DUF1501 domain-containing protein [Planctomycetaceae bacterium]
MLTLSDSSRRFGRRDFLRIGALSLGASTEVGLAASKMALAAGKTGSKQPDPRLAVLSDRTIIFLHMQGGPSQIETFDPKMAAPVEIRSLTGEIATKVPGLTFGSTFPQLARRADRLTIVRSFVPGDAKHDIKPVVSAKTHGASLGAVYARVAGATDALSGLPTSVWCNPRSVNEMAGRGTDNFGLFNDPGTLGASYAPFIPGNGGPLQQAMRLSLPLERVNDRRSLLGRLDSLKRSLDVGGNLVGMDEFQAQAFNVILNGAGDAFDLSQENPRDLARYDTAPLVPIKSIDKKWNNYRRYIDHSQNIGKLLLLTRRLVEAGVGFITVSTDFVWDNHADSNNAGIVEGMDYVARPFDHAVSMFLDDLEERGLADKVLLVCCGEMGRGPRINKRGGRDHWGNLGPLLLAGGGLPRGRVYGQSTRDGGDPQSDPVTQENLLGTIMNAAFDVGKLRLVPGLPADILRLAELAPIPDLG